MLTRRIAATCGLVVAASIASLLAAELVLRAVGFSFQLAPSSVEFGYPNPVVRKDFFVDDPDLWWVGQRYETKLARLANHRRHALFLGDSCTQFGVYPKLFLDRVRAVHPYVQEGGRLGVGGWSSHQGLRQLVRDVVPLRPRVVTLYFGWNDHWAGFGVPDEAIDALQSGWLAPFRETRLAQLLLRTRIWLGNSERGDRPLRVPPESFRRNLTQMVNVARDHGIVPVLITAPTSHRRGFEPAYLAETFLVDLDELVPLHQQYVTIVREVAEREDAVLCDAARAFEAYPPEELRTRYFEADGIHLTRAGDEALAASLWECFEAEPTLRDVWAPFDQS